jgi:two-component system response regulator DesR
VLRTATGTAVGLVAAPASARTIILTSHGRPGHLERALAADAIRAGDNPLTPLEAQVLALAADGAPVDQIAHRAALTAGTVRNYLSTAGMKLGASNRYEAVRIARRYGWI